RARVRCLPLTGGDPITTAVRRVAEVGPSAADSLRVGSSPHSVAPLPHVARGVVEPVTVGGEGAHGAGAPPPVGAGVLAGEGALPDVHPVLAAGLELGAPGE